MKQKTVVILKLVRLIMNQWPVSYRWKPNLNYLQSLFQYSAGPFSNVEVSSLVVLVTVSLPHYINYFTFNVKLTFVSVFVLHSWNALKRKKGEICSSYVKYPRWYLYFQTMVQRHQYLCVILDIRLPWIKVKNSTRKLIERSSSSPTSVIMSYYDSSRQMKWCYFFRMFVEHVILLTFTESFLNGLIAERAGQSQISPIFLLRHSLQNSFHPLFISFTVSYGKKILISNNFLKLPLQVTRH